MELNAKINALACEVTCKVFQRNVAPAQSGLILHKQPNTRKTIKETAHVDAVGSKVTSHYHFR